MSYQPEKASFLLSTSTLLLNDLENTVKNKRLMFFFVLHFQTWALEFRDKGEDLTAPIAQLESLSLSEHGILPPSTGESSICLAVSSCWSPCLLFSASFGQVTTAGAIFHLLWCTMKNWPLYYSRCVCVSVVVPALKNGQIGCCCSWALITCPSKSPWNYVCSQ